MGLFSSKTRIYVGSQVWNLAGDADLRPNLLRQTILGSVLSGSKEGIGTTLSRTMRSGSGWRQQSFFRWSKTNYDLGLPSAEVNGSLEVDTDVVMSGLVPLLGLAANQEIRVTSAIIDAADVDYWAEYWMLQNRPNVLLDDWTVDWDTATSEIVIDVLEPVETIRLPADADLLWGMDQTTESRRLLFAVYTILTTNTATKEVSESAPIQFIYRMGSGNVVFDTLQSTGSAILEFFPVLPLRIDNKSIRDVGLEDTYDTVKTAFRKLTSSRVDKLLDQIEDNENIADIDYCFLVHGISLNTKEQTAQAYIYAFFKELMNVQKSTSADFLAYKAAAKSRRQSQLEWNNWIHNNRGRDQYGWYYPDYGKESPVQAQQISTPPTASELRVHSIDVPDFDYRIDWTYVDETLHLGNGKTHDGNTERGLMKPGEYWVTQAPDILVTDNPTQYHPEDDYYTDTRAYQRIWIFHQYARFKYSRLEILGLGHRNYVYRGHPVRISAKTALEDEEESGFLIPLHYPAVKSMGLLKANQLATSNAYLVFNSYKAVEQKWYQRGIFKFIMLIVGVVLSILLPPLGVQFMGAGILGSHLAVGTAMGISSTFAATLAGAIANAITAMVVSTLVQQFSIKIFGEKFGAAIGAILSFVALTYASAYVNTGSFHVDWSSMLNVDNLMKVTNAVSRAYTAWLNADTTQINEQIGALGEHYDGKFKEIDELSKEILGVASGEIDPMMFTDATEYFGESSEAFIGRTLLTGNELAELSQVMIEEFAEISLELPMAMR